MWNAFAWHPHEPGKPYSNREPTPEELRKGLPVLRGVLSHFAGVPVVPVGRKAEETLMVLKVKAMPWVRHPVGRSNAVPRGTERPIYFSKSRITPRVAVAPTERQELARFLSFLFSQSTAPTVGVQTAVLAA